MANNQIVFLVLILIVSIILIYKHIGMFYNPISGFYFGNSSKPWKGVNNYDYPGSSENNFVPEQFTSTSLKVEILRKLKNSSRLVGSNWIKTMEEKYKKINENIYEVCQKHKESTFQSNSDTMEFNAEQGYRENWMLDTDHQLAYCKNAKVGTTTWINHFFNLLDRSLQQKILKRFELDPTLPIQIRRETQINFQIQHQSIISLDKPDQHNVSFTRLLNLFFEKNTILRFSFVRHPFERLVSAYKDKVLHSHSTEKRNLSSTTSFSSFVHYVLDEYQKNEECRKSQNKYCRPVDRHWNLYNFRCLYCDIPYDVIGKMESFNEDVKYIVVKQQLDGLIPLDSTVQRMKSFGSRGDKFEDGKISALSYFSSLTKLQIKRLYEVYKFDLELFDYNIDDYLGLE